MERQEDKTTVATGGGPGSGGPARTLRPVEVARALGRGDAGKRQVNNWCTHGVRGGPVCPHDVRMVGARKEPQRFLNLEEVLAWGRGCGLELRQGVDDREEAPLLAPVIDRQARERADREEAAGLELELVKQIVTGDAVAAVRQVILRLQTQIAEMAGKRDQWSPATVQQLANAVKNISHEARQMDELARDREEHSARMMPRAAAVRVIAEAGASVRNNLGGLGADLAAAVRAEAIERGVGLDQPEAFDRVAAVAAQRVLDRALSEIATAIGKRADDLAGEGAGPGGGVVGGGVGGGVGRNAA